MEPIKEKQKNTEKDFNPKDAILVFTLFTFFCAAIIFALLVYDVLTIQDFISFDEPAKMVMNIVIPLIGLLLFGIFLTIGIPSKYIDDTNKSFQNMSLSTIFVFLFIGAIFEELFFRGIIQNSIYIFTGNQWIAIITATLLFVAFHVRYFKKPIMLINITLPGLVFGWIYFETKNLLVPFLVHFLVNLGITLLLKYNVIRMRK
ncbi:CPBP family intramembrane metalloprotease [Bacillus sp. AGMB 02131]|uniref:CPBP family intramembrane metalloprotease n=1 Tax=Peribacillus faecalis TaxID=2772559 RepID=A0A927CX74_9BACI|nr:CPBP family intramembrane glutamic endopeptidase [Peribacillus faecalis]MBD3109303.1 CPBP family intramembrane metalloprotease [Peribacillus faecalis]